MDVLVVKETIARHSLAIKRQLELATYSYDLMYQDLPGYWIDTCLEPPPSSPFPLGPSKWLGREQGSSKKKRGVVLNSMKHN